MESEAEKEQQGNFSKAKEVQTVTSATIINVIVPGELHVFKKSVTVNNLAEAEIDKDSICHSSALWDEHDLKLSTMQPVTVELSSR